MARESFAGLDLSTKPVGLEEQGAAGVGGWHLWSGSCLTNAAVTESRAPAWGAALGGS